MKILDRSELLLALDRYIYEDRVEDRHRLKEILKQAVKYIETRDADIGEALRVGAEEGFRLAKKVYLPENFGGMTDQDKKAAFGTSDLGQLSDLTHAQAREEYENWKDSQEPKIGDQVIIIDTEEMGVVTSAHTEVEDGQETVTYEIITELLEGKTLERDTFRLTGRKIDLENGQFKEIGENGDTWKSEIEEIRAKYTIGLRWWAAITQVTDVTIG